MHPAVLRDGPGRCPECGMHLVVQPHDAPKASASGPGKAAWSVVGAIGILALVIVVWGLSAPAVPGIPGDSQSLTHDQVTVTATRLEGGTHVTYRLEVETHSVDLSAFDAVEQSVLEAADGTFPPAPGSMTMKNDGHHIEAELVFETAPAEGQTLILKDLAGRAEWRLAF